MKVFPLPDDINHDKLMMVDDDWWTWSRWNIELNINKNWKNIHFYHDDDDDEMRWDDDVDVEKVFSLSSYSEC